MATYKTRVKRSWKFVVAITAPFLLLPILFVDHDNSTLHKSSSISERDQGTTEESPVSTESPQKFKLAYVILLMAIYWAFEIIPLPITALFPLVLFPLLGIDDAANVSKSYMKESNTIFLGGAIVALAVEFCNLHRRVALRLITVVGVSPRKLMFGIMAVASFLSMWISNTACTTMIVPIIVAIVDEIHDVSDATNSDEQRNQSSGRNSLVITQSSVSRQTERPQHTSLVRNTFANIALSSHETSQLNADRLDERGALGVLEGHHSEMRRSSRYQTLPPRQRLASINRECNNNIVFENIKVPSPDYNDSTQRMPGRRASSPDIYLNVDPSENTTHAQRIESFVNFSPPTAAESNDEVIRKQKSEEEKWRNIKNMYLFALAYSANIGGTATITGTGPNKVFKEVIKPYYYDISQDGKYLQMTYFTWMAFNLPPMLVNNVIAWIYLTIKYCGLPKLSKSPQARAEASVKQWKEQHVRNYLLAEYKKLGKMSFHELGVATVFLLVVFLWILRDPQIFKGWHEVVSDTQTGDSTAALLGAVLLFIIPRNWAFLSSKNGVRCQALLDWSFVTKKLPWGVLLLTGSAYAIGDSVMETGFSKWIGEELYLLHNLPQPLLLLIVMLITAFITEVVSNTACASVILPILLGLSREMNLHPLYLSVPVAVTASYAFMLPIASPVNSIVFAAGDFSIFEMIANGYILNGICVFVFYINTLTLGEYVFEYSQFNYDLNLTTTTSPLEVGMDNINNFSKYM